MRSALTLIVALLAPLSPTALHAEPAAECGSDNVCLSRQLQAAEREMDELVVTIQRQTLQAGSGPSAFAARRSFDDAQSMFVVYRGITCNWQYNGATTQRSETLRGCMVRMTQQRNDELRLWLADHPT